MGKDSKITMKTPHHPQCGDCSGEKFRSGECDGLIAVGEEGGITVYKPCAARISVEEARATAIRLDGSNANLSPIDLEPVLDWINPSRTRTRVHAREAYTLLTKVLTTPKGLGSPPPLGGVAVIQPVGGGVVLGTSSLVSRLEKVRDELDLSQATKDEVTQLVTEQESKRIRSAYILEGQGSTVLTRQLVALTSVLGLRSKYYHIDREVYHAPYTDGSPNLEYEQGIDVLGLYGYDTRGQVPGWALQKLVEVVMYRLDHNLPLIVTFSGRLQEFTVRHSVEECLVGILRGEV